MKKACLLLTLLLCALLLCACGTTAADPAEPTPSPTAAPTPTPFPEPVTEPGGEAWFDGHALADGYRMKDGVACVRLSQVAEALGAELTQEGERFSFAWRKSRVKLTAGRASARYLDQDRPLEAAPLLCAGGEDLLVPVKGLCDAAEIGFYDDAELNSLYCTPATGDWALEEGYAVPMLMYHMVDVYGSDDANLIVRPDSLEEQFQWLLDNDFTPIWFEDLWHVEDFPKPVILVFDDGYSDMYRYVYPLAEQYKIKVEIALITDSVEHNSDLYLNREQVLEMKDSPYISFQSHSVSHPNLAETWFVPDPEPELRDSALYLMRLLKKAPVTFVYPSGGVTPTVQELVRQYYRFGVIMVGEPYVTGMDPTLMSRYFIERQTPLPWFAFWLNESLNHPELKNYCPREP